MENVAQQPFNTRENFGCGAGIETYRNVLSPLNKANSFLPILRTNSWLRLSTYCLLLWASCSGVMSSRSEVKFLTTLLQSNRKLKSPKMKYGFGSCFTATSEDAEVVWLPLKRKKNTKFCYRLEIQNVAILRIFLFI